MDKNDSYFRRSFWFVWIGFTTSLLAFLLIGLVGTTETEKRFFTIQPLHGILISFVTAISAIVGHFLFRFVQKNFEKAKLLKVDSTKTPEAVGQMGMALVYYTIVLAALELPAAMAFMTGFLGGSFQFMLPFIIIALCLQVLSLPKRLF